MNAGYQVQRSNLELDAFSSITEDTLDRPLPTHTIPPKTTVEQATRIGWLFLISNSITILMTVIPVLVELPDIMKGEDRKDWYGVDDLFRLWEPIIIAPFHILLMLESQYYSTNSKKSKVWLTIWFALGMAIYQQGAGFHSASNMLKHAFETVRDKPNAVVLYPVIEDVYHWTRDVWEHTISHYWYACGGVLLSFFYQYVYCTFNVNETRSLKILWSGVSITYALMIAAVGAQYPKGPIVALVLCVCVGLVMVLTLRKHNGFRLGNCFVIKSYLLSYILAFLIVLGYGIKYNFKGRNEN